MHFEVQTNVCFVWTNMHFGKFKWKQLGLDCQIKKNGLFVKTLDYTNETMK